MLLLTSTVLGRAAAHELYWLVGQMLAHLTSNGCKRGDTRSHRKRDRLWCCRADPLGGKISRACLSRAAAGGG